MSISSKRFATHVTSLRLTPQERRTIERASSALRIGPSTFVRRAALDAASKDDQGGAFRDLALARWTSLMGQILDAITDLEAQAADASVSADVALLLECLRDIHRDVTRAVEGKQ